MRLHGTLVEWNDDRGFGFIEAAGNGQRVFVHASAFPRGRARPAVGESVSFLLERDPQGRPRAAQAMRPQDANRGASTPPRRPRPARRSQWAVRWAAVAIVSAFALWAWVGNGLDRLQPPHAAPARAMPQPRTLSLPRVEPAAAPARFQCDGRRYCSEMRSCEEAMFFLRNCPDTRMDGDGDGIPCEDQWCR